MYSASFLSIGVVAPLASASSHASKRSCALRSSMSTRGASDADVLRWFERDRTEAIGGADALSALKERDGVIVVVSGMDGFRCRPGNIRSGTSGLTVNNRRMAGVRVR